MPFLLRTTWQSVEDRAPWVGCGRWAEAGGGGESGGCIRGGVDGYSEDLGTLNPVATAMLNTAEAPRSSSTKEAGRADAGARRISCNGGETSTYASGSARLASVNTAPGRP